MENASFYCHQSAWTVLGYVHKLCSCGKTIHVSFLISSGTQTQEQDKRSAVQICPAHLTAGHSVRLRRPQEIQENPLGAAVYCYDLSNFGTLVLANLHFSKGKLPYFSSVPKASANKHKFFFGKWPTNLFRQKSFFCSFLVCLCSGLRILNHSQMKRSPICGQNSNCLRQIGQE